MYYKGAVAAVAVFDLTRPATLDAVLKWKEDLNTKVVLDNQQPVPCILLANKVNFFFFFSFLFFLFSFSFFLFPSTNNISTLFSATTPIANLIVINLTRTVRIMASLAGSRPQRHKTSPWRPPWTSSSLTFSRTSKTN